MTDCVISISAQDDLFRSTFPIYVDISDRLADFVDALNPAEVEPSEIVPATTLVGRSQVHHGDAAEILPTIEGESVGLVVTSPPYNIGTCSCWTYQRITDTERNASAGRRSQAALARDSFDRLVVQLTTEHASIR